MVKLQKHKAYTYTSGAGVNIEHFKHLITVPDDVLEKLGWSDGQEFEWVIESNTARLQPRNDKRGKKRA